jgi:broad specificity phosphatase PhoE
VAIVRLVRHGQAAAAFHQALDPGLSDQGRRQAEAMADQLAPLGPLPVLVSPLRRTRETAAPLAQRWGVEAVVDERFAEIPSPTSDLAERAEWLQRLFGTAWHEWPADLLRWRAGIAEALLSIGDDTVVVTHYVPIISAVAAASGDRDPEMEPGYCSVTTIDTGGGRLSLVEAGSSGPTVVL